MLSEFVPTYTRTYSQHAEKSASLSFKFNLLSLPCLKLGNSREYRNTVIFRAPPRAVRVVLQLQMTVTIILCALFLEKARLK